MFSEKIKHNGNWYFFNLNSLSVAKYGTDGVFYFILFFAKYTDGVFAHKVRWCFIKCEWLSSGWIILFND